jgi:murein DD-endopeptidase MepM/ murein hydrolase activator NlpD
MRRSKFKYDHENLRYLELNKNFRSKLFRAFTWIMASLIFAILINVLYASFFDTPVERQVKQENKVLSDYYHDLTRQFVKIDTVLKDVRAIDENLYRTIFETEPVFKKGINENENIDAYFKLINIDNQNLVSSTKFTLDDILQGVIIQSPQYKHLMNFSGQNREMLINLPAIQPIRNSDLTRLAAGYGIKVHPNYRIKKFHNGMDFIAPTGTEVYATGGGVVESLERTRRGNGNTIIINHGFGYKSVYSYLDNFNVKFGKTVKRGDVIGWVGNTELSIAPHLHYEILLNNKTVNPVNYFFLELSPEEYNRIILLSAKTGQSFD